MTLTDCSLKLSSLSGLAPSTCYSVAQKPIYLIYIVSHLFMQGSTIKIDKIHSWASTAQLATQEIGSIPGPQAWAQHQVFKGM